jgi:hypothetical protein
MANCRTPSASRGGHDGSQENWGVERGGGADRRGEKHAGGHELSYGSACCWPASTRSRRSSTASSVIRSAARAARSSGPPCRRPRNPTSVQREPKSPSAIPRTLSPLERICSGISVSVRAAVRCDTSGKTRWCRALATWPNQTSPPQTQPNRPRRAEKMPTGHRPTTRCETRRSRRKPPRTSSPSVRSARCPRPSWCWRISTTRIYRRAVAWQGPGPYVQPRTASARGQSPRLGFAALVSGVPHSLG